MPTTDTCSEVKDGSVITSLPLYFGLSRSSQVFGSSAAGDLVAAQVVRHQVEPLADEQAVRVLGGIRHLVEVLRLEGDEQALLAERVGGRRLRMGQHVDRDPAGVHLLLEAAQNGRAAGAEHLDLDAVFLLERVDDLLALRRSASRCTRSPCPRPLPWRASTASWAWAGTSVANSASVQSGAVNLMAAFPCSLRSSAGVIAGRSGPRATPAALTP